jgi:hypothetical protein
MGRFGLVNGRPHHHRTVPISGIGDVRASLLLVLFVLVSLLACALAYLFVTKDNTAASPDPFDAEVLRNEESYLKRAQAGDTGAGYELALAYRGFDSTDERAVSTLRLVARMGNRDVDRLLGMTLLQRQLKRLNLGLPLNAEEEREALELLESVVASGRRSSQYWIDDYLRRKAQLRKR